MSLRDLFGSQKKLGKIEPLVRNQDRLDDVESVGYIDQFIKDVRKFRTHTDFHTASNFAVYGSLREYYRAGIERIIESYPYDGSLKEKLEWVNESSGFDLHLFEKEYPRTNGYITFSDANSHSTDSWGTVTSTSGAYGNPATKEYIYIKGGPNVGNVYNTASMQTSNLEINGRNGNTVEFWLKKSEYVTSKTDREVILDITTTGSVEGDHKYGRLTIELDSTDNAKSPFLVTYQSGSTGFKDVRLGYPQLYASGSDNKWHHYAISLKNVDSKIKTSMYVDGNPHITIMTGSTVGSLNTAMVGSIGALVAHKDEIDAGNDGLLTISQNAIQFSSAGDGVDLGDQASLTFNNGSGTDLPFSISTWIKIEDVSAGSGAIISKRHAGNDEGEYYIDYTSQGAFRVILYDDPEGGSFNTMNRIYVASANGVLQDDTWHHIVITYDGSKNASGVKIYLDGSALTPSSATKNNYGGMGNDNASTYIGGTQNPTSNTFEDYIADTVFYDKELSAAEVTEVRNGGRVYDMNLFSAYDNIISWYKMGDDGDTTGTGGIRDYKGTNHGTLIGDASIFRGNTGLKAELKRPQSPGRGYGKLSGSLDEFRYWKKERTEKDIGRFWFTNVGAGSNTDVANTPLGFYYKFNEGKVGQTSIDRNVLDYSGRLSNGEWVGYSGYGRSNNSAIVEASASAKEFKDPILYRNHPSVVSFENDSLEKGYAYDLENNSSMYHSYPAWIVDEDGETTEDLKRITQVVASYFDSLFLQIKDAASLKHLKYKDINNKPHQFNDIKLKSLGFVTPELFMDASTLNVLVNRDEGREFESNLADVKNFIYNNIYNNLESIFKSKGTLGAFRNLFRCHGIDNELIKVNLYSTNAEYPIDSSYIGMSAKTKYVNFANSINKKASVFQSLEGLTNDYRLADARGYMTGSEELMNDDDALSMGLTAQAQVFFPKIYPLNHKFHYNTPQSASILGCHSVRKSAAGQNETSIAWTSADDDHSNFQLYVVKENLHSRTAKFVLKSRNGIFDPIETGYVIDLYDSNRWNVAVKLTSDTADAGSNAVTGSAGSYKFRIYAVNTIGDTIHKKYSIGTSISEANARNFIKHSRRFYIGAERQDFSGTKIYDSDVKIANFRVWNASLTDAEIDAHALDPRSIGVDAPSRLQAPLLPVSAQASKIDLLAVNWDFSNLTGSNTNGKMWINDISSGSIDHTNNGEYGAFASLVKRIHPGVGVGFASSTTSSVDMEFDNAVKLQTFENVMGEDMVKVMSNDDITFTRETKPTDYFFSFEKSMYGVISDEMLNFFAGITEFSNLIGAPVERYRPSYKGLNKLRQIFFSRIQNEPDIERFTEYYKWLDTSLSIMIDQLVPASVAASEDIRNMIESHVLERSKYFNKFPTMDFKVSEPVGQIRGINELMYDWQHGHAPVTTPSFIPVASVLDVKHDVDGGVSVADTDDAYDLLQGGENRSVTISLWAHLAADQGTGTQYIAAKMSSTAANRSWYMAVGTSEQLYFGHFDTDLDESTIVTPSSKFPLGQWNHVVATLNPHLGSGQEKIYVNGVLVDTETTDADQGNHKNSSAALYIGNIYTAGGAAFHGQISNFVFFKHGTDQAPLDDTEVLELYNAGHLFNYNNHSKASDIVGWYKLNGNALDSSANGRNGSLDTSTTFAAPDATLETRHFLADTNTNCLWHKDRAQRSTDLPVLATLDPDREVIRRVKNTSVSGSTYAVRKLSRPYRLSVEDQRHAKGGDNTFGTKRKRLYTGISTAHRLSHIAVTGSEASSEPCKDVINPSKKHRFHAPADIAYTNKDRKINDIAPFTLYSSSLDNPGDYKRAIFDGFKQGVEIANLHSDEYGDDREVTLQSPFTERWVGGNAHRHQDLSASLLGPIRAKLDGLSRQEAFKIMAQDGKLYVVPPNTTGLTVGNVPIIDHSIQSAQVLRTPLAKRPVNIDNIHSTTSSISLGNYNHIYDIVQYTSEDQRKDFLVDNLEQMTSSNSISIPGVKEFAKFARPVRKTVFKARFASPGGPEVAGDSRGGHSLDRETNQYSVYNSMNYRNLSVRGPLDYLSKLPQTGSISGRKAQGTITVANASAQTNGDTISIKLAYPHPNGSIFLAEATNSDTDTVDRGDSNQRFAKNADATITATNMATALNAKNGLTATSEGAVVTVTQEVAGPEGNTTITLSVDSGTPYTKSNFSNGNSTEVSLVTNHKINANPRHRFAMLSDGPNELYKGETYVNYDNVFVQHPIPQNDYQYAWITSSLVTGRRKVEIAGHLHSFTQASLGSVTGSLAGERTYEFLTASGGRNGETLIDFVGLNTHIRDSLDVSTNTVVEEIQRIISFDSETVGKVPSGWEENQADEDQPPGQYVVANSLDPSDKILAFSGYWDNTFVEGNAPRGSSHYRWAAYAHGFETPLKITFEYILGSDSPGLSHLYGLTNKPETEDDLFLQYKVGTGGTYNNLLVLGDDSNLVTVQQSLPSDKFHTAIAFLEKQSDKVYFRWVQTTAASEKADHYGIRNIIVSKTVGVNQVLQLNNLLNNRQGPYGHPSWKQIRAGQTQLGRYLNRNNIFAPIIPSIGGNHGSIASPGTVSRYNYPERTIHRKIGVDRRVDIQKRRYTESAVSSNRFPVELVYTLITDPTARFQGVSDTNDDDMAAFLDAQLAVGESQTPEQLSQYQANQASAGIAGIIRASTIGAAADSIRALSQASSEPVRILYTFANDLSRYANDDLSKVTQVQPSRGSAEEKLLTDDLLDFDFTKLASAAEYSIGVFPKEHNMYLKKHRQRTNFTAGDFWETKRNERTKDNHTNSQGNTIPKLSVWPLDEPENFKTTALKKTTDKLGDDGAGELFANYSIFHNNLTHPSASALFARPFPMQSTSSLPATLAHYDFRLAFSLHRKAQFFDDVNFGFPGQGGVAFGSTYAPTGESHGELENAMTYEGHGVGVLVDGDVPPGFVNDQGDTGGSTTDGVRINHVSQSVGDPITHVSPIIFRGTTTDAGSITGEPGSLAHYRFLKYTGSFDLAGEPDADGNTDDKALLINFHLTAGERRNTQAGSTPWFAETQDSRLMKFYVQVSGSSTQGWLTVGKFGADPSSEYFLTRGQPARFCSVLVTSSLGDGATLRFISGFPTYGGSHTAQGNWVMFMPTFYVGSRLRDRKLSSDPFRHSATLEVMTGSRSPLDRSYRLATIRSAQPYAPWISTNINSAVGFGKIDNFADEKNKNAAGANINPSPIASSKLGTYDTLIKQMDQVKLTAIYAKNDKIDNHLYGSQFFKTPEQAGRNPFNFDNYEDFVHQGKLIAKDCGVLPEFRISEHMNNYINTIGGADPYFSCNDTFMEITGSDPTLPSNSGVDDFYETYSHTDFMKHFRVVEETMETVKGVSPSRLKLECKAFKKFLPYKGFYPADRMTQLASEFSSSFSQHVTGGHWRNVLAPYYAPGIGFNSIKSGVAVDWPVFEPHEDRIYNQYGVIFMSSSLLADRHPNGIGGQISTHTLSARSGIPTPANHIPNGTNDEERKLSLNRIEFGGASQWASLFTGSMSPAADNQQMVLSCWIYLPKHFEPAGPSKRNSFNPLIETGLGLGSFGLYTQRGVLASFGSTPYVYDGTVFGVEYQNYWKNGFHFVYWIGGAQGSTINGLGSQLAQHADVNRGYTLNFGVMGGDGKDFFFLGRHGMDIAGESSITNRKGTNIISSSPGWNHVLLTLDPDGIGAENWNFSGFRAFLNGQEYNTISHLTASSGFRPTTKSGKNTAKIKLDGVRNCFFGNNLSMTKFHNEDHKTWTLGINQGDYQHGDVKKTLKSHTGGGNTEMTNTRNQLNGSVSDGGAGWLVPSEFMMSEIIILNAFDEHMPEALSGYPSGKVHNFYSDISGSTTNKERLLRFDSIGNTYGPANPYTTISSSFHDNIIGWYRPGNDTGYVRPGQTNGLHVFNHAQPLFSGKIINNTTGSSPTFDDRQMPMKYNHLTGTMYGFTDWTGSLYSPPYSDKYIQRWNGIVDISNPAQYVHAYAFPTMDATDTSDLGQTFKTWYAHIGDDKWFTSMADISEKKLIASNEAHLSSSYCAATGSTRIPTFVLGTGLNFTSDGQIPRIGSASYGTYHYTGSDPIGEEPMFSQGWRTDYQKNTGIRKCTRVPFEAIIDPLSFTPEMKEDGAEPSALFYELEPHPSASLLGAFSRKRKYIGQNAHGQQVFRWSSAIDNQQANIPEFVTDENFHFGVAMNSSSVLAEFDLQSARSKRNNTYTLAASNFYAEAMNFFLENKKGVTIRSKDVLQSPINSNLVYEMSIELNSGRNKRVKRDFPMYNNPSAFGMPFDAGRARSIHVESSEGEFVRTNMSRSMDKLGYGFSPYLPPHYDEYARAKYTFTPDPNTQYTTVDQVLGDTSVVYYRKVAATGSIFLDSTGFASNESERHNTVIPSYNRRFAMHISASFNGLGLDSRNTFVQSYNPDGSPIQGRRSIVFQTKYECPTFDFGGTAESEIDQPRTSKTLQHLPKIRGIWHQDGNFTSDRRPHVKIISPSVFGDKGDLSALLGMEIEGGSGQVGELPEETIIREAVVAIPFRTNNEVKSFFNLPPQEVYQAVRNLGYRNYKLNTEEDRRNFEEYANLLDVTEAGRSGGTIPGDGTRRVLDDPPTRIKVRPTIQSMVNAMMKYNIPPQFNFLKYNDPKGKYIRPFAMYMFEFEAKLSKEDLARIWQNITPDIGLDNYGDRSNTQKVISTSVVEHELFGVNDLLNPKAEVQSRRSRGPGRSRTERDYWVENWTGGLNDELQWMVFKVKQKASTNYFKKKRLDRLPDGHPEKIISVEHDIFEYGFNWPYDYFSLVELVNLKSTVGFTLKDNDIDAESAKILKNRGEDL